MRGQVPVQLNRLQPWVAGWSAATPAPQRCPTLATHCFFLSDRDNFPVGKLLDFEYGFRISVDGVRARKHKFTAYILPNSVTVLCFISAGTGRCAAGVGRSAHDAGKLFLAQFLGHFRIDLGFLLLWLWLGLRFLGSGLGSGFLGSGLGSGFLARALAPAFSWARAWATQCRPWVVPLAWVAVESQPLALVARVLGLARVLAAARRWVHWPAFQTTALPQMQLVPRCSSSSPPQKMPPKLSAQSPTQSAQPSRQCGPLGVQGVPQARFPCSFWKAMLGGLV